MRTNLDNLNDLYALSARRGMRMTDYRIEKDFLGELKVPKDAYWGAQTQRAIENFPISGIRFGRRFIYALGLIKMACAQTNVELGLLDGKLGKAIVQGCQEVMDGKLDDGAFRHLSSARRWRRHASASKTITVRNEGGMFPNQVGTESKRTVTLQGDQLRVSNPTPASGGRSVQQLYNMGR